LLTQIVCQKAKLKNEIGRKSKTQEDIVPHSEGAEGIPILFSSLFLSTIQLLSFQNEKQALLGREKTLQNIVHVQGLDAQLDVK
jgi:hypothetical protein